MLFVLLLVPCLIGLYGLFFSHGKIVWQEFLIQEGAVILVVGIGYAIAYFGQTSDKEIWSGTIARKWQGTEHCCHSYPCNCRQVCSGSGKNKSCSEVCDTCYRHYEDTTWNATTSNNETAYYNGCNSPYSSEPSRYRAIQLGEPTAIEHSYTNYIKGNPDTIIKRTGVAQRFAGSIPKYPEVYDWYRAQRIVPVGVNFPNLREANEALGQINAELGAMKKINIILVVTNQQDQMYLEAIREAWLGGKKNDVIVVIGAPNWPEISWAGVISWSKAEDMKVSIRNRLLDLKTIDQYQVLKIIYEECKSGFVHRHNSDFEYLESTMTPPTWALWFLFILGCAIAGGLEIYFWQNDPFEMRYNRRGW